MLRNVSHPSLDHNQQEAPEDAAVGIQHSGAPGGYDFPRLLRYLLAGCASFLVVLLTAVMPQSWPSRISPTILFAVVLVSSWYGGFGPGQILASNNVIGPSRFNQFRTQVQYGRSDKRGFSGAASVAVDVQSGAVQYYIIQSTYNWDCCGINPEYRRIRLGTIRNENQYRISYSLANIGSFGNLLWKERLY